MKTASSRANTTTNKDGIKRFQPFDGILNASHIGIIPMQNHRNCLPAIENDDPEVKYDRIPDADNTMMRPKTMRTPAEPSSKL
jgi:hypothetical protein